MQRLYDDDQRNNQRRPQRRPQRHDNQRQSKMNSWRQFRQNRIRFQPSFGRINRRLQNTPIGWVLISIGKPVFTITLSETINHLKEYKPISLKIP